MVSAGEAPALTFEGWKVRTLERWQDVYTKVMAHPRHPWLLLAACLLMACAGGRNRPNYETDGDVYIAKDADWTLGDGVLKTESGVPIHDQGVKKDKGTPTDKKVPKADSKPSPKAQQTVINKIKLPTSGTAYALDLDGNGTKDNQIGLIVSTIKVIGGSSFNLQGDLDKQMAQGKVLMLFNLRAKSLVSDPGIKIQMYEGKDTDGNPADNFTGKETLAVDKTGPMSLILDGKILGGFLSAGSGNLMAPIPIGGLVNNVSLKKTRLSAMLTSKGMIKGQINGAIPMSDVDSKILPGLAKDLDKTYKKTTDPNKKKIIASFDTDGNGTITGTDLKNNAIVGMILKPDVDTDGDKKMDGMSLGIGFTAVNCKISGI